MLSYFYFLWLFTVCGLWGSQAQNQEPSLLDQIANHQQQWFRYTAANQAEANAKIDSLKEGIEGQLQAQQVKTEIQQHSLRVVMDKMKDDIEELKKAIVDPKPLNSSSQRVSQRPSNLFEKIGSRYFYIEQHDRVNWFAAFNKCRRFGGYLATINDEEELQAITKRSPITFEDYYWLDITSLAEVELTPPKYPVKMSCAISKIVCHELHVAHVSGGNKEPGCRIQDLETELRPGAFYVTLAERLVKGMASVPLPTHAAVSPVPPRRQIEFAAIVATLCGM